MMLQESEIIPYRVSMPPGERVVVMAPHPDDETLGCGGAVRLLIEAGKEIRVVFLTSGDKADPANPRSRPLVASPQAGEGPQAHVSEYSLMREREAEKALKVLGVSDYEFLRFPDRGLYENYMDALYLLLKCFAEFMPDTVYVPSMVEVNPDHRAAAALALDIQKAGTNGGKGPSPVRVVFYEISTPLRPNMLVDITGVYGRKKKAIRKYGSQLKLMDYLGHITALNTVRALTADGMQYAEAFWSVERPPSEEGIIKWLSYGEILKADIMNAGPS